MFAGYLYWLTHFVVMLFWLMDVMNMPFMEMFDTTYPLNGLFWFLVPILNETAKALCGQGAISKVTREK